MEKEFKQSLEKVRAFASDILEQCQNKSLTIQEVKLLLGELPRQAKASIEKRIESEKFLK